MARFEFIVPVWGKQFLELLLNFVLPNHLQDRNLLMFRGTCTYKIYTRHADVGAIVSHASFQKMLAAGIDASVAATDCINTNKFDSMIGCHRLAIAESVPDSCMVFLSPDVVWSSDAFSKLAAMAERGARAVLVHTMRLAKEEFRSFVPSAVGMTARSLVREALPYQHPSMKALYVDSPVIHECRSTIFWRADEGFVAKCFHLHPLLIRPVSNTALPRHTIDDDYLPLACPDPSTHRVVTDSDDFVGFELTDRDAREGVSSSKPLFPQKVLDWAPLNVRRHHLEHFKETICIHAGDTTGKSWVDAKKDSEAFCQWIVDRYS